MSKTDNYRIVPGSQIPLSRLSALVPIIEKLPVGSWQIRPYRELRDYSGPVPLGRAALWTTPDAEIRAYRLVQQSIETNQIPTFKEL